METVTGYVTGINGNLANVSFDGAVHKNEVAYILVDGKRLKGYPNQQWCCQHADLRDVKWYQSRRSGRVYW